MPVIAGREWQYEIEARLRELLPIDFPESLPIYLAGRRELSARFEHPDGACTAYTGLAVDLRLRPWLECLGLWKGRGFAAVFFETEFPPWAPSRSYLLRFLPNIALHEAAHYLEDARSPAASFDFGALSPAAQDSIQDWLLEDSAPIDKNGQHPSGDPLRATLPRPFHWHESQFTRAAVHLVARTASGGFHTTGDSAKFMSLRVAGERYGMSGFDAYREALGDEPQRLEEIPIREILATPAPAEFEGLWRADLRRLEKTWRRARVAANWCPEPFRRKE